MNKHQIAGRDVVAIASAETGGGWKMSLQAMNDHIDVSELARSFGGGGHRRAAGFTSERAMRRIVAMIETGIAARATRILRDTPH